MDAGCAVKSGTKYMTGMPKKIIKVKQKQPVM
jgi:hypothetical protein